MARLSKEYEAYDKAMGELKKAGLLKEFAEAAKNDSKLATQIDKIAGPKGPGPVSGGWSCCVTVKNN